MIGCIVAQKPQSKLKLVTLDKEINMNTPWRREEFQRISGCSKKDLVEKAQETEVTIPVKKSQEKCSVFFRKSFLGEAYIYHTHIYMYIYIYI